MPNVIKFSESGSANSIRKGRASIGINAVSYAPTSQTGFWNGMNVPIGGYIVYQERTGEDYTNYGFSAAVILDDSGLIGYARASGAGNIETVGAALAWIATQPGLLCVKGDYPDIVTDGLVLNLDASFVASYPTTGTTWYDISEVEPTVNLVSSPKTFTTGYSATTIQTNNQLTNFDGTFTAGLVSGSGYLAYTAASTTNGTKYTTSWYLKAGTNTSVSLVWGGAHHGNRTNFSVNLITGEIGNLTLAQGENYGIDQLSDGWWRVWYSSTLSSGNNYYPQIINGSGTIYIGALQIEQKPSPSPFVVGSRVKNNGTLENGPTFDSANGGSIVFDGNDDYTQISTNVNLTNPLTICAIVNISVITGLNQVIYGPSANGNDNWFSISNNRLQLLATQTRDVNNFTVTGNTDLQSNTWYYLTGIVDTNVASIYINGALERVSNTQAFTIGGWNSSARIGQRATGQFPFNGKIAYVHGYNRALSAAEILQNYYRSKIQTSGLSMIIDAQNLVSNETQTTITDLTSSKYVFTYEGTVTKSSDFGGTLRLAPGRIYRSVISWYGNYTFGFWFKSVGSPAFGRFYTESNRGPSGCSRVYSNMNSNGTFTYIVWDNSSVAPLGGGQRTATSITNVQNGDWHFITCIWSNGSSNRARGLYLFVNGTLEASQDMIGNDGSYQHLHLGGSSGCTGTASFNCYLGPIMQYSNLAMNDGQVKDLYESYKTRYQ